jgi:hypothetical protein
MDSAGGTHRRGSLVMASTLYKERHLWPGRGSVFGSGACPVELVTIVTF